ncbi:MAG: HNH endonuclease signature motif containing protein [Chloroflexota bacterium]|nr:HNH endonuclease signature motif containing protein [Chloroflexota bacterium]MDE2685289.1 HNH endonuclease signature motif containing protein [Chloroflexota bacterium]
MLFDPFAAPRNQRVKCPDELKAELLKAQGGKCMYCGAKQRIDLMDCDHKNPIARGGSNTKRNFQVLCRTCNTRKGAKTDREFRRMYKDAGVPQTQTPPAKTIRQSAFEKVGKQQATAKAKRRRNARFQDPWNFF